MQEEIITLGENFEPPSVDIDKTKDIYSLIKTDEFDVETFNSLLFAIVTYLDEHDVDYGDKALPWAEVVTRA